MPRLRALASSLLVLVSTAVPALAEAHALAGRWQGAIHLPGSELGVTVDLRQDGDGAWSGDIDIPLQAAEDLLLEAFEVDGEEARFTIAGIPGTPTFHGKLADDGATLEGSFTQGGQLFTFSLSRQGDAPPAGPSVAERLAGFDPFAERIREAWHIPGMAIAIVADDRVAAETGYGLRDVEAALAVDADTRFAIGSATKAFTALLLAQLVDAGTLDWDQPVRGYLPDFALHDQVASEQATLRDLASHRTGLPRHDLAWYGAEASRATLFERLRHLPPSAGFRSVFQYQNLMYMTAGYLAGQLAGSSWEELVRTRIFEPLGMNASDLSIAGLAEQPNAARGYAERPAPRDDDGDGDQGDGDQGGDATTETVRERLPYRDVDAVGPAGSINASVHDMARWLRLQLSDGSVDGTRLVSAHGLRTLHTPQMVINSGLLATLMIHPETPHLMYALGWFVQSYRGHEMVFHGGNIDGFSALVAFLPRQGYGVVVLSNLNGTLITHVLAYNVFDRLLGLEPIDWNGRMEHLRHQLEAQAELAQDAGAAERQDGTRPSHPLADYAGAYRHPGYGPLQVTLGDGEAPALRFHYHALDGPLEHWHYDTFRIAGGDGEGIKVRFALDDDGHIGSLHAVLEPSLEAIAFSRQPPAHMQERAYLETLTGRYRLAQQTITIALRADGALTAIIPGQPIHVLRPHRDHTFRLEGLSGFSVRFDPGDSTRPATATFEQPNGTFTATRQAD